MGRQQSDKLLQEAAKWWLRRREGGAALRREFSEWLEADARHGEAFDAIQRAWDSLGVKSRDPAAIDAGRIVALARLRRARQMPSQPVASRRAVVGGMIAAGAAAIGVWTWAGRTRTDEYATLTGERLQKTLSDGSKIELDANSHLRVHMTDKARRLELVKGRVMFDVAKDLHRPFIVEVAENTVTAVGTAFSVEYREAVATVTLFRGAVRADSVKPGGSVIDMIPGDRLSITSGQAPQLVHGVDLVKALAWRYGRLYFDSEPLAQAVERMNDYSPVRIVVGDSRTAKLRISGTYEAGQSQVFLDALQEYYGLSVVRQGNTVTLRSRN